ncbi:hypothetical protein D3C81_2278150 [compost metagenome]
MADNGNQLPAAALGSCKYLGKIFHIIQPAAACKFGKGLLHRTVHPDLAFDMAEFL